MQISCRQERSLARADDAGRGGMCKTAAGSSGRFSIPMLIGMLLAASMPGVAAEPPQAQQSRAATAANGRSAAGEIERSLQRLESRAGQTRLTETSIVVEMTERLDRIILTVGDLKRLVTAIPIRACPPAATICPDEPEEDPDATGRLPWLPFVAGAATMALLLLVWRRKRESTEAPAAAHAAAVAPPPAAQQSKAPVKHKPPAQAAKKATPVPPPLPELAEPPTTEQTQAPPAGETVTADAELSLELADIMLSMGLAGGAAQTLEDHIRQHPRQALLHWMKLLDVYRRSRQRAEFEHAARDLQQHFNIAPPEWESVVDPTIRVPSLEHFPHISNRVQELWPGKSCIEYLERLLDDNRSGTRTGFPQPVVEEILLLLSMLRG